MLKTRIYMIPKRLRNIPKEIRVTILALVLGMVAGLAVRFLCPASVALGFDDYLFSPLYSLFLTAVAMIMVPMVFFSILSSISGFNDMGALGRTGGKVFAMYLITTLIGVLIAIGMNQLCMPGRPGMMNVPEMGLSSEPAIQLSLKDKLIGIVPESFVGALSGDDMLQVMFIAVLLGVACTRISSEHAQGLRAAFDRINALFTSATVIIAKFLPFAIFGAVAQMALNMEVDGIGALASWVGVALTCYVIQVLVYMLLIWGAGRMNPLTFIKKFLRAPITAFLTCSSSATMPTTMSCCKKMGISQKIYSLSIPLGVNINMDGTSILFTSTTLFLAGLYGISVSLPTMLSLIASVMMISVALPGVPGAGTACIMMLFSIVGVPAEAFGLIIGLMPMLELFETSLNVTGDGAVTAIVARSEGELDLAKYNS